MSGDFRAFVQSLGLQPGAIVADGAWRRCRTESHPKRRNGSYMLRPDGLAGFAQDFSVHSKAAVWKAGEEAQAAAPFDPVALARSHTEARRKQVEATQQARDFYLNRCTPLREGHVYLDSHGLDMQGCLGLKVDAKGWLVVPAFRDGNLMTVQRISPDGEKRFWPGAPVKGSGYTIERRNAPVTVICEGLATGLAIFASAGLTRVLVAFNSGNLGEVQPPRSGMLCVAADNDWKTICQRHKSEGLESPFQPWELRPEWCLCNPGRKAAEHAAELFGCGVAMPGDLAGTDFCDYRMERTAARLAKKLPHQRDSEIFRSVDAEIAAAISRAACLPDSASPYLNQVMKAHPTTPGI